MIRKTRLILKHSIINYRIIEYRIKFEMEVRETDKKEGTLLPRIILKLRNIEIIECRKNGNSVNGC